MREGILFYDETCKRINVRYDDGGFGDGFRCGAVITVKYPGSDEWVEDRIELDSDDEWYLVDKDFIPVGTRVKY